MTRIFQAALMAFTLAGTAHAGSFATTIGYAAEHGFEENCSPLVVVDEVFTITASSAELAIELSEFAVEDLSDELKEEYKRGFIVTSDIDPEPSAVLDGFEAINSVLVRYFPCDPDRRPPNRIGGAVGGYTLHSFLMPGA